MLKRLKGHLLFIKAQKETEIMICPYCKEQIENHYTFCPKCGQSITTTKDSMRAAEYWQKVNQKENTRTEEYNAIVDKYKKLKKASRRKTICKILTGTIALCCMAIAVTKGLQLVYK